MNSRNRKVKMGEAHGAAYTGIVAGVKLTQSEDEFKRAEAERRAAVLAQVGARIATRAAILQSTLDDLGQDICEAMVVNGPKAN